MPSTNPNPPDKRPPEPFTRSPTTGAIRVAASRRATPRWLDGLLVLIAILAAGTVGWLARGDLGPALARGLAAPGDRTVLPTGAPLRVAATPGFDPVAVAGEGAGQLAIPDHGYWTLELATERLEPVPDRFDGLIAEGREEVRAYRRVRSELFETRWTPWRTSWRNRVEPLVGLLPPPSICAGDAALEPRCLAMQNVGRLLLGVSDAESVAMAVEGFDGASERLEAWREAELLRLEELARLEEEARLAQEAEGDPTADPTEPPSP